MGNGEMVFYRIKKVKGNYYLVKEWYDPELKKKITRSIGPCKFIEEIMEVIKKNSWCGGWDLNPRRPTPSGPKPDPFVLARAPPHIYRKTNNNSGVF